MLKSLILVAILWAAAQAPVSSAQPGWWVEAYHNVDLKQAR
jgi:hypothetical protein